MQYVFFKKSFSDDQEIKSKVYGFPIFRVGYIYLITQTVVSIVFMICSLTFALSDNKFPAWIAAVVCIIIIAAFSLGMIGAEVARETVEKIVIGDSRCCQLGINQYRHGRNDFAVFAVWGGHYTSGYGGILTESHFTDVENCFRTQIKSRKKSSIYLFATVNDYDCWNNSNSDYINSVISTAERLASMSYEMDGVVYHPQVSVIGFDGCWLTGDLFGTPQETFNHYVQDYNDSLESAWSASTLLSGVFTTVPNIVSGKAGFIDDGLHYSDDTLEMISAYIVNADE